jgi:hypothetical protein
MKPPQPLAVHKSQAQGLRSLGTVTQGVLSLGLFQVWRFVSLGLTVIFLLAVSVHAAEPQNPFGGVIVEDRVPYQPAVLHGHWTDEVAAVNFEEAIASDRGIRLAGLATDTVPTGDQIVDETEPQLPPGTRDGVFQKLLLSGTWLPQLEDDGLGWGDLEAGVVLGFPFFRRDTPLIITPRYGVHFIDGAANFDLPTQVYDASFEFRHMRKFGQGPWAMDVAVTLGHYSDYESADADAFRVSGRGIAVYETQPGVKWLLGVAYLNRAGASVLPIVGVIYDPDPSVSYELIFPRPRVSWQLPWSDPANGDERWVFVGGEFGGGVWSIEHPSDGAQDLLTYSDVRVLAGYERKIIGGLTRRFEFGYVFARQLEFNATPEIDLDDSLFARVSLTY